MKNGNHFFLPFFPFFFFFALGAGCGTAVYHTGLYSGIIFKSVLFTLFILRALVRVLSCYCPSSHSKIAFANSKYAFAS
jgi:hypothetical protein